MLARCFRTSQIQPFKSAYAAVRERRPLRTPSQPTEVAVEVRGIARCMTSSADGCIGNVWGFPAPEAALHYRNVEPMLIDGHAYQDLRKPAPPGVARAAAC